MNRKTPENTATFLLCTAIMVVFCTEVILNLTPPISRDALIHHLAIPKLWLKHGGYYEIPWADYSYYPMYINLLYLIGLYFKNDIIQKFIHFSFGLGTGWLIYHYLKQKYDLNWALLGVVIFITTPIVVWLSTSAYIDLGMTFFTTGSVLAFIKWRDSEYSQLKWLLIFSFCMGIAAGSKYNALIAWFIMNLMLMLSYVRDTNKQIGALQYGILFFAISVLVAQQPVQEVIHRQFVDKTSRIGFFQMREIMYGESFWETLLIPLRMFFQGEDNSYRYFQGALNPILILFAPFTMLNKKYKQDKIFFALFSALFIFMAYFLTEKQVRYILPVLPFLSILAVMGIKDLTDKLKAETFLFSLRFHVTVRSISRIVLFACVSILLASNLFYLRDRINIIKPLPYIFGQESRENFLKRHLLHYNAVRYINANLMDDAKVFTMFLGRRGYYLDRTYKNEPSFGRNTIIHMVNSSTHEKKFTKYVRSMNVTHILMRTELVDNYLKDNFSQEEIKRFLNLAKKCWKLVYETNGYTVWDIQTKRR